MDISCRTALRKLDMAFGGLDKLCTGDLAQLPPVGANPLYLFPQAPKQSKEMPKYRASIAGKQLFESFDTVFLLTEQNRIAADDADGQTLLKYFRVFSNPDRDATYSEVEEAMEAINAKAVTPEQLQAMLPNRPKAVVLRNSTRDMVNRSLAVRHADATGKRLIMWRAKDTTVGGRALKPEAQAIVNTLNAKKTNHLNGVTIFYEGCPYVFLDNKCTEAGYIHNNGCTGQGLLLHPDEPEDDASSPVRWLKYPPLAMFVKPDIVDVGDVCHQQFPECPVGCIPVTLQQATFKVSLPTPVTITTATGRSYQISDIKVKRRNLPLGDGHAFTDHYCQGMSFKQQPWLADLRPPEDSKAITAAAVAVILSRYSSWSQFMLLCPLWDCPASKKKVVDYFYKISKMHPHLRKELQRLQRQAAQTEETLIPKLRHLLPPELFPEAEVP